ncbi:DUF4430 domain-containing protein [Clostridium sp. DMHC 10]|uniref:DUF4430 domain-containing protein n=1 Tax=Clostridium sp. DMHC 10 TaxID=747377 RepID=UPI00069F825E|nr:DUF4430 domain-containing protein [Clostridium sp. DMHC 10]
MKKKIVLSISIIVLSLVLILGGNALRNNLEDNKPNNISKKITAVNKAKEKQVKSTPVKDVSQIETKTSSDEKDTKEKQSTDNSKETAVSNKSSAVNKSSNTSNKSVSSSNSNTGVSSPISPKPSEEPNLTVVDALNNKTILSTYVDVNGKTVGEVTLDALRSKGIPVESTGSGYALYISSISGIREREHGKNSGWIYFVNRNSPQVGCGGYKLKQGDKIEWKYSSN